MQTSNDLIASFEDVITKVIESEGFNKLLGDTLTGSFLAFLVMVLVIYVLRRRRTPKG
jgi:hypothetical protein